MNIYLDKDITTKAQFYKPIIIIREPYDRFISIYNYWKNGSTSGRFQRESIGIHHMKLSQNLSII